MLNNNKLSNYKIFVSNPPFINIVFKHNFETNLKILNEIQNVDIIICVPDRRSYDQYIKNIETGYISYGKIKNVNRQEGYDVYDSLNKYIKYVINMNDYKYYDYFRGNDNTIEGSTIFICLSNYKSKLWKKFIKFISKFRKWTDDYDK